jgi:esterase/lipase
VNKNCKHVVIILPGAGDDAFNGLALAARLANRDAEKRLTTFVKVPIGWRTHLTAVAIENRYEEIVTEVENIVQNFDSVSFFSISAGTSIALLLALKFEKKLKSVANLSGCVQYDKKYFETIHLKNFETMVKKLDDSLKHHAVEAKEVGKKTMTIVAKKDETIPLELQHWELAAKEITINHYFHISSTMIGAVYYLARGEKDQIWRWLVDGPTTVSKNS